MMLCGGGVINYVVKRRGRGASRGTMFLPWRAHTMSWGRSGLRRRRRRCSHLRGRGVRHERLEGVELLLRRRRRRRLARGAQPEGRRRVGRGGGRLARRHGAAGGQQLLDVVRHRGHTRHCGLRLNARLRSRLKRGFPSLAAQARALELRGRPDSELLSLATQTSACEVRVCLASPAILVGFLGDDASKPHETHPDRTSSTYLDPPKRGLKF